MDFLPILFNALNRKYGIDSTPPFVGEFSDKSELPPDQCAVPFYFWKKPNNDIVFSCNNPLIEDFAATLAIKERLEDVTIGDILHVVDKLCKIKGEAFMEAMRAYFEQQSD